MKPQLIALLALGEALFLASSARADGGQTYLGLHAALGFPSTSSVAFPIGASVGYKVSPLLGVTVFYQSWNVSIEAVTDTSTSSIESTSRLYGASGDLHFSGSIQGVYIGVKTGMMVASTDATASDETSTVSIDDNVKYYFLAPRIGYDHMLGNFSVGGEGSFLTGVGSEKPSLLSVAVVGKFWF